MILLLRLLWGATKDDFDTIRRTFKLTALLLIIDAIVLMAVLIKIAFWHQTIADPWVSGVGLLWMALTALAIFIFAGPWLDMVGVLDLFNPNKKGLNKDKQELNKEGKLKTLERAGSSIIDALRLFFAIQGIIVGFLFFIPVWRFPAGIFILPILIASVLLLGYLTDKPLKFLEYLYYISLGAIFVVIAVMVITGLSGNTNTNLVDWIRANPLILVAAFAFIAAALTKEKGKSFAFFTSVGGLALAVGIFLILYEVSPSSVVKEYSPPPSAEVSRPAKAPTERSARLVPTGYTIAVGEQLIITRKNLNKPAPLGAIFTASDSKLEYAPWAGNKRWVINNDRDMAYEIKLKMPQGLMLKDLAFKLMTSDQQNENEGDLPRNLEIIS